MAKAKPKMSRAEADRIMRNGAGEPRAMGGATPAQKRRASFGNPYGLSQEAIAKYKQASEVRKSPNLKAQESAVAREYRESMSKMGKVRQALDKPLGGRDYPRPSLNRGRR